MSKKGCFKWTEKGGYRNRRDGKGDFWVTFFCQLHLIFHIPNKSVTLWLNCENDTF